MWDKIPVSHAGFLVGSFKWTSVLLLLLLLILNHSSGSAPCITVYAHVFPLATGYSGSFDQRLRALTHIQNKLR